MINVILTIYSILYFLSQKLFQLNSLFIPTSGKISLKNKSIYILFTKNLIIKILSFLAFIHFLNLHYFKRNNIFIYFLSKLINLF